MSNDETEAGRESRLGDTIRGMVDRTIQRSIKGVDYFLSAAPAQGVSSSEIIYRHGPAELRHYHPTTEEIYRIPLLIVSPPSNRGYFLDMLHGMSMAEFLLERGYDLYVLEWSPPRPEDKHLGLEDYTHGMIRECIKRVQIDSGVEDVNLAGYCFGGVLSAIYAAAHPDGPVSNLLFFTLPVDFSKVTFLASVTNRKYFDVDTLVDSIGNVPSEMVLQGMTLVDPVRPTLGRIELWENMWNDEYVRVRRKFDRWINDLLPLPGELFRQLVKELLWENGLYRQSLVVGGDRIKLSNIRVPVLNVMAQHDNVVPIAASEPLVELIGSEDKQNLLLKGGHTSLVVGPNAKGRLWPMLDEWLAERSM